MRVIGSLLVCIRHGVLGIASLRERSCIPLCTIVRNTDAEMINYDIYFLVNELAQIT